MDHPDFKDHSYFAWLLAWRAVLAAIALYTALEKPFWTMMTTLVVLGFLLAIGEAVFKSQIYFEQKKLRQQKDRELREQRAEEARLRREAMEKERQASRRSLMNLDLDDDESSPDADANRAVTSSNKSPSDSGIALATRDFHRTQERQSAMPKRESA
jgi:hypothetical protein